MMKDTLQVVSLLFTPLIAILALYIAVQQHSIQRDKLRLDLYEKRLAVFEATMNLLATVQSDIVPSREAIYRFISGTANARFLFGPDMEEYLDTLGSKVMVHRSLYDRMVKEQKEGKTDSVNEETESLKALIAETEKAKESFQPYLGFAVRASGDSGNYEAIFFRLMLVAVVVSALGFGAVGITTWQRSKGAREAGRTFNEIVVKREQVCDSAPQSLLCDAEQIKEYRKGVNESFEAWSDLRSQSDRSLTLAWAVPLACVLAFYAGRWVVTAKFGPLRSRQGSGV